MTDPKPFNLSVIVLLFLIFLIPVDVLRAQGLEIGIHGGGAAYSGDLSPREFGFFVEDFNLGGGAYLRYRPSDRLAFRVIGSFGRLTANRVVELRISDEETVAIERNFRSKLEEISLFLEYDILHFGNPTGQYAAFYAFGGVGLFSFQPQGQIDGIYYNLQPLATEGQGINDPRYDPAPYELTRPVFTLGGGIRAQVADRIVVGVELGGRVPGTDYIDDVSDTNVNYLDVLENSGSLAARFSNPAITDVTMVDNLNYRRGGEFNDYYFVGSITIGVLLGRSSGNNTRRGSGCYEF